MFALFAYADDVSGKINNRNINENEKKKRESLNVTQFEKLKSTTKTNWLMGQRRGLRMIYMRITLQTEKCSTNNK